MGTRTPGYLELCTSSDIWRWSTSTHWQLMMGQEYTLHGVHDVTCTQWSQENQKEIKSKNCVFRFSM